MSPSTAANEPLVSNALTLRLLQAVETIHHELHIRLLPTSNNLPLACQNTILSHLDAVRAVLASSESNSSMSVRQVHTLLYNKRFVLLIYFLALYRLLSPLNQEYSSVLLPKTKTSSMELVHSFPTDF